ncbi:hypothetical protein BSKO_04366 [Bryopsis sp. KO-2023]|nr:hypothetical protein BSKO_04366 [Bryopsis sp. KO-2023]
MTSSAGVSSGPALLVLAGAAVTWFLLRNFVGDRPNTKTKKKTTARSVSGSKFSFDRPSKKKVSRSRSDPSTRNLPRNKSSKNQRSKSRKKPVEKEAPASKSSRQPRAGPSGSQQQQQGGEEFEFHFMHTHCASRPGG